MNFEVSLWISFLPGIVALIIESPENVAVNVGSGTTLNCTSSSTFFSWAFQAANSQAPAVLIVTTGCVPFIGNPMPCNVTSNNLSPASCQLIISNASPGCAGFFICSDVVAPASVYSSMVIVLDANPGCSANATNNTQLDISSHVMMNCDVSYTTPYLRPHLNWSQPSNNASSDNSYAYSSIIETNVIPRIWSDMCRLSFNGPIDPPQTNPISQRATNIPSYISSCTVQDIFPKYCPLNVNISGAENGSKITNGTILSCSADANPLAMNIEWQLSDAHGTEISLPNKRSPTIPVYYPGYYTCNITNDLPGCYRNATLYITDVIPATTLSIPTLMTTHETSAGFWTTSPSQDVNTTERCVSGTGCESSNDGLIAVCVCLGISVTINIIITVLIVVILRRQRITTKQRKTDDHVGSVSNRYCEEITAYENVAQSISTETTGYEQLNPSIDISPYQELADRHTN